jgi:Na+/H+ antiporter NhaD/arsenite permease-like protein
VEIIGIFFYDLNSHATFYGFNRSIANLITFEQAKQYGIKIGFVEHARVGIPVTLLSLIVTFLWIRFAGFG